MAMIDNSHHLADTVLSAVRRSGGFGLDDRSLDIRYVLNHGGFVNASFHVTDGRSRLHVKVARDADACACLSRWATLAGTLADRYLAPRVLGTLPLGDVDVDLGGGSGMLALVMEHVDGRVPERHEAAWSKPVVAAIGDLHADRALADALARLSAGGVSGSDSGGVSGSELVGHPDDPIDDTVGDGIDDCAAVYLRTFDERFTEDLRVVREARPPFVSPADLDFLAAAADRMRKEVLAMPAFAAPADAPTHGDLWRNNILVGPGDRVTILDWDDLAIGDGALDWAILFGYDGLRVGDAEPDAPLLASMDADTRARFDLYRRATLLDWAIDPLADWVEADDAPEHAAAVRAEKERVHGGAMEHLRGE